MPMLHHSVRLLMFVLVACTACDRTPAGVQASAARAEPGLATNVTTICKTASPSGIPSGYVILQTGSSTSCPNYSLNGYNTYTIGLPASPESICRLSPVPAGWIHVSYSTRFNCPQWASSWNMNTINIQLPGAQATMCRVSPTPAKYVHISSSSSATCPQWASSSSNNTITIKLPGLQETICNTTPVIPANYVVTGYTKKTNCPDFSISTNNATIIKRL